MTLISFPMLSSLRLRVSQRPSIVLCSSPVSAPCVIMPHSEQDRAMFLEQLQRVTAAVVAMLTALLNLFFEHLNPLPEVDLKTSTVQLNNVEAELATQRALLENLVQMGSRLQASVTMKSSGRSGGTGQSSSSHGSGGAMETNASAYPETSEGQLMTTVDANNAGAIPKAEELSRIGLLTVDWGSKHRGHRFHQVFLEDPDYVDWMLVRKWVMGSLQVRILQYCIYRRRLVQSDAGREMNLVKESSAMDVSHEALNVLEALNQADQEIRSLQHPCTSPVDATVLSTGSEPPVFVAAVPSETGSRSHRMALEQPATTIPDIDKFRRFIPRRFRRRSFRDKQTVQALEKSFSALESTVLESHVTPKGVPEHGPIDLLEVFAYPGSRLTQAVQESGGRAMRFTALDGDLSTVEGQRKLMDLVDRHRPRNIFVAPECGPWSSWSRFNQSRSSKMFDKVQEQKRAQSKILKLCNLLCEIQVGQGRHFHIEQPSTSSMFDQSALSFIRRHTKPAILDMCRFSLRCPLTDRLMRKRTVVRTTSESLFADLDGQTCIGTHAHQQVAGSTRVNGMSIPRSKFAAAYSWGFARKVAQSLLSPKWSLVCAEPALPASDDPPLTRKRFKVSGTSIPRASQIGVKRGIAEVGSKPE